MVSAVSRFLAVLAVAAGLVVVSQPVQAKADGVCGSWSSLGGNTPNNPVTAIDAVGRLEVFARGTDNTLFHRTQLVSNTCDPNAWSPWATIGSGPDQ